MPYGSERAVERRRIMLDIKHLESIGVEVKTHEKFPGLFLLSYSQVNTPKSATEAYACRGHIVDSEGNYKCRPFDRFFNFGERQVDIDWNKATIVQKLDGSLIKIWNYNDEWYIATRGTFIADSAMPMSDITFEQYVVKTFGFDTIQEWKEWASTVYDKEHTYLYELTSPYNRVVVPQTDSKLWFLGMRNNITGKYIKCNEVLYMPKQYSFSSLDECVKTAKTLPFTDEGYVVCVDGEPVMKIKSAAYVAVHRMRGDNGITPSRICDLVWLYDEDEYLSYFPDERVLFQPYITARDELLQEIEQVYQATREIKDQKEFALAVKDKPYSSVLFAMRKYNIDNAYLIIADNRQYQEKLLLSYMKQ